MKLSFPAPFFGSFFGRAKNEQMNRVQKMNNKIIIIKIFHGIKENAYGTNQVIKNSEKLKAYSLFTFHYSLLTTHYTHYSLLFLSLNLEPLNDQQVM